MALGEDPVAPDEFSVHKISTDDFDALARGTAGAGVTRLLRDAERSRRLLLVRALTDIAAKNPALSGPLPSPEDAWELLARVQESAPDVLDLMLAHPYTGAWAGYTIRLLRHQIAGVFPLWVHTGHLHALAAAAAIRAGLDFTTSIPSSYGFAALPSLGVARFEDDSGPAVAEVTSTGETNEVSNGRTVVRLPADLASDSAGWWGVRHLTATTRGRKLSLRLDDVDLYRSSYEPLLPQRLPDREAAEWEVLLGGAWELIAECLPDLADAFPDGFVSLVPRPKMPFRTTSSSSEEAFGSAIISRPDDPASLAAALVHEFQHNRLSGLLHLKRLHVDDPVERFYAPWRDDPRPLSGVFQGVYAFFGVAAFWRALSRVETGPFRRIAQFEFVYWRQAVWQVLRMLQHDAGLTVDGRRFLRQIAEQLEPWQREPVPMTRATAASGALIDHYAAWRLRHLRPDPAIVNTLAEAWTAGRPRPALGILPDGRPTPVPDGRWRHSRHDLARLAITDRTGFTRRWPGVPQATTADFAYTCGRFAEAAQGYRAELEADPDSPPAWTGLGLALSRSGTGPAASALLHQPELVRAVYRVLRAGDATPRTPDELAGWLGWLRTGLRPGP